MHVTSISFITLAPLGPGWSCFAPYQHHFRNEREPIETRAAFKLRKPWYFKPWHLTARQRRSELPTS